MRDGKRLMAVLEKKAKEYKAPTPTLPPNPVKNYSVAELQWAIDLVMAA